jgi:hypothetical protein
MTREVLKQPRTMPAAAAAMRGRRVSQRVGAAGVRCERVWVEAVFWRRAVSTRRWRASGWEARRCLNSVSSAGVRVSSSWARRSSSNRVGFMGR